MCHEKSTVNFSNIHRLLKFIQLRIVAKQCSSETDEILWYGKTSSNKRIIIRQIGNFIGNYLEFRLLCNEHRLNYLLSTFRAISSAFSSSAFILWINL